MHDKLLAEARQAQERLIDAERDAEVARAEFHRAVRSLHLHGASLRDIAAELGLSHQRVHQIAAAAGGSRRWGRGRDRHLDLACRFCGSPQHEVRKLIAGPGVYICEACVELAERVLSSGSAATTPLGPMLAVPAQDRQARCRFCGKRRDQVAGLAAMAAETGGEEAIRPGPKASGPAAICRECLSLCDEIIADELA
jgi:ClpX C4-type zinc finger